MKIPYAEADRIYSNEETELIYSTDLHVQTRLRHYRQMLGDRPIGRSLDVGGPNPVGRELGAMDNTLPGDDFNFRLNTPQSKYDTIFCFEVIEHVMNPLILLTKLQGHLADNGRIYLSTPILGLTTWYQHRDHFSEYKLPKLRDMIGYAGLVVEQEDVFSPYPKHFAVRGVRPVLRVLFHRNVLFCLKKSIERKTVSDK